MATLEKNSTTDKILHTVKVAGDVTAEGLSRELNITKEGARKHLLKLEQSGLLKSDAKSEGVGRPVTHYSLTDQGLSKFPDTHAQVTVDLLKSVKHLLGDNALDLLISDREKQTYDRYREAMEEDNTLEKRLDKLVKMRTREGYMADWKKDGDEYFLIENHCPICAAATECQGFCRAELKNFKQLIGEEYQVERVKHILAGEQRCVYSIKTR
ncbi:helix-turn-helix transcriptional regulator [Marinoscillum sp.]|uniref:helix-turn-helix transcriptional regulator n=1 Tax=Marinoscillum sp. TaxID=2024838 RepID=UPI003BA91104